MHQISENQWLEQSLAVLEQEKTAIKKAYDEELAAAGLTS